MKPGAVSNTYDNLDYTEAAASHFESEGVDAAAHCGDTVAPSSVVPFDADFDSHAVRGDNDGEWTLREVVESFGTYHGDPAHLTPGGQEIAVYHGMEAGLVDALVGLGTYDLVLYGHSHERVVEHRGMTTHINPDGLPIPGADDAFHAAVADSNMGNVAS